MEAERSDCYRVFHPLGMSSKQATMGDLAEEAVAAANTHLAGLDAWDGVAIGGTNVARKRYRELVILDTSVLEGRYLWPLLRGDPCYDIQAITNHGYEPAVLQKTLGEVWSHAVLGKGNSSGWTRECIDYPDTLKTMEESIGCNDRRSDAQRTAWFWYNLAEEWQGRNERLSTTGREFLHWKSRMKHFCLNVEHVLKSVGVSVVSPWVGISEPHDLAMAANVEREVALNSLLPSEDCAWIVDSVILGARAAVTCDEEVIYRGRISLGLNLQTPSFVHPSRLRDALEDGFALAFYGREG